MTNAMLWNLWYEDLSNFLKESFDRRILEHYRKFRKPAISQTLTYRVEQPVPSLNLDQYFFGSVTITDDESKRTVERLSREIWHHS